MTCGPWPDWGRGQHRCIFSLLSKYSCTESSLTLHSHYPRPVPGVSKLLWAMKTWALSSSKSHQVYNCTPEIQSVLFGNHSCHVHSICNIVLTPTNYHVYASPPSTRLIVRVKPITSSSLPGLRQSSWLLQRSVASIASTVRQCLQGLYYVLQKKSLGPLS